MSVFSHIPILFGAFKVTSLSEVPSMLSYYCFSFGEGPLSALESHTGKKQEAIQPPIVSLRKAWNLNQPPNLICLARPICPSDVPVIAVEVSAQWRGCFPCCNYCCFISQVKSLTINNNYGIERGSKRKTHSE